MEAVNARDTQLLKATMSIEEVLQKAKVSNGPMLWLVTGEEHEDHLAGYRRSN